MELKSLPKQMDAKMDVHNSVRRNNQSFLRSIKQQELNNENAHIMRRMEEIHFRNWEKGHIGGEIGVPAPKYMKSKKLHGQAVNAQGSSQSPSSLNYSVRKTENERINTENIKLFRKLS